MKIKFSPKEVVTELSSHPVILSKKEGLEWSTGKTDGSTWWLVTAYADNEYLKRNGYIGFPAKALRRKEKIKKAITTKYTKTTKGIKKKNLTAEVAEGAELPNRQIINLPL